MFMYKAIHVATLTPKTRNFSKYVLCGKSREECLSTSTSYTTIDRILRYGYLDGWKICKDCEAHPDYALAVLGVI